MGDRRRLLWIACCLASLSRELFPGAMGFVAPSSRGRSLLTLFMAREPDLESNDAFRVLGLDPSPSLDKKEIKRAYKRLALKYHPDVSQDSDKKRASDRFAKINWAYETLSGKNQDAKQSTSAGASSSTSGWQPPHRRTSSYSSGNSNFSTDWRDYMPKYDEEQYDSGGDSFGAIFSDLFAGAASVAGGRGGVFRDFVEFLENNVDGYTASSGDDAELRVLLQTGTLDEIAEEMDDTDLVVQQLSAKLKSVEDELIMVQAEINAAQRFSEKITLDERLSELKARKDVVEGYIKKARKRLISLQTRYKELIVGGANDSRVGGRTRSSWDDVKSYSSQSRDTSARSSGYTSPRQESTSSSSSSSRPSSSGDASDSWKSDSFGSFGRGRGSSRRKARSTTSAGASASSNTYSTSDRSSSAPPPSSSPSPRQTSESPASTSNDFVPPHRRTTGGYSSRKEEDRRRLKELKVDEEFDKLKKELGL